MSKKNAPTDNSQSAFHKKNLSANSNAAQRARLLNYLREFSCTTLQARDELNIMSPAARVKELREAGYNIVTNWVIDSDHEGREHKVGQYVLLTSKQQGGEL